MDLCLHGCPLSISYALRGKASSAQIEMGHPLLPLKTLVTNIEGYSNQSFHSTDVAGFWRRWHPALVGGWGVCYAFGRYVCACFPLCHSPSGEEGGKNLGLLKMRPHC